VESTGGYFQLEQNGTFSFFIIDEHHYYYISKKNNVYHTVEVSGYMYDMLKKDRAMPLTKSDLKLIDEMTNETGIEWYGQF
jgi:hypothetical protein